MPRFGVTGHMNLTEATTDLVDRAIRELLAEHRHNGLVGVSCIAAGADSIFAKAVLDLGGELEVVLPSADYRQRKVQPEHHDLFDTLMRNAAKVTVMPFTEPNRAAYESANDTMLSAIDQLIAVWDGHAPADKGGTGHVVQTARQRQIPIQVIWPQGAKRS